MNVVIFIGSSWLVMLRMSTKRKEIDSMAGGVYWWK